MGAILSQPQWVIEMVIITSPDCQWYISDHLIWWYLSTNEYSNDWCTYVPKALAVFSHFYTRWQSALRQKFNWHYCNANLYRQGELWYFWFLVFYTTPTKTMFNNTLYLIIKRYRKFKFWIKCRISQVLFIKQKIIMQISVSDDKLYVFQLWYSIYFNLWRHMSELSNFIWWHPLYFCPPKFCLKRIAIMAELLNPFSVLS